MEKVQKRAVAMISGLAGRTYKDRLRELGMVMLQERRQQTDMLQVFNFLHGKETVAPSQWFRHSFGE